ncbi:hypothetical protein L198_01252 [Cryptococcus wingfieldii CBS 7118]|uniref:Copper transport protein n=1 Tax=Cryptococcus wingfieldii CBS 7118 TaxID=1295528 RepID=A0A1E3JYQ0_9TREE|nr:hypothetical protein L198_01252 [Cryptococcus wingfieldii CBS 7118]ODO06024.1 hypothetical protein L198_01252 [Cryptococcus wingfieldii CBS 7118]
MTMKMYFHGTLGTDMLWFASWMPSSAGATVGVCIALFMLAIFERYLMAFRRACDVAWRKGQIGYARPTASGPLPTSTTATTTSTLSPSSLSQRHRSNPSIQKTTYNAVSAQDYPVNQDHQDPDADAEPVTPYTAGTQPSSGSSAPSYSLAQMQGTGRKAEKETVEKKEKREEGYAHLPKAVRRGLDPGREDRWSRPFRWGVDLPRGLLQALQTTIHYLLMLVVMTFNIWWCVAVIAGSGVGEMLFGRMGASHGGH